MKKLYILLGIMIVLLCSFASADLNDELAHVWDFEETSGNLLDKVGPTDSTTVAIVSRTATGINGNAWEFDSSLVTLNQLGMVQANDPRCFSVWINATDVGVGQPGNIIMQYGDNLLRWRVPKSATPVVDFNAGGTFNANTFAGLGGWYLLVFSYDGTDAVIWINDTLDVNTTISPVTGAGGAMTFGDVTQTDQPFDGFMDEFYMWNRSCGQSDVDELWGGGPTGDPAFYPFTDVDPPTFINPPNDGETNNTNITINITAQGTDLNFSLWVNDDPYFYNVSPTQVVDGISYFNWTTNLSDGSYTFKSSVFNRTSGLWSANATRTWILDSSMPTITIHPNNAFNSSGTSSISQYADYFFINLSVGDETELFGMSINVTRNGISYFNFTNLTLSGLMSYNYSTNLTTRVATWPVGEFNIEVIVEDAHTAHKIPDYEVSNGIRELEFDTAEGNNIKISSDGSSYSTTYTKLKDRYNFGWNYLLADSKRKFTIEADSKIYYLPNSKYIGHFVIGDMNSANWMDFEGLGSNTYTVNKISDYRYEITFTNLPLETRIIARSLGGVNRIATNYSWYRGNTTTTVPTSTVQGTTELFRINLTRNLSFVNPSARFIYDGVQYDTTSTSSTSHIEFSRNLIIPSITGDSENINWSFLVNVTQSADGGVYNFSKSGQVNVSLSLLDDCTTYNRTVLVITGKDEETDLDVNMELNIYFTSDFSSSLNISYGLSGSINYSFCSDSDSSFELDAVMEYGDGTIYTDRKYYLNNLSIFPLSGESQVFLYHLNNTKASEITLTVFDRISGERVRNAFIEILRYYPEDNIFRIVEIEKTDENGEALGKMVLADVFYKYIVRFPANTIKLDTGILKVISLTRALGISVSEDFLETWKKIGTVDQSVTCTRETQTCRITWSDSANIVKEVTLEVWRMNGLANRLLFKQTLAASSGTISYTVIEDTAGNRYVAKGFIEDKSGITNPGGVSDFFYSDNPFFTDEPHRLASLFPLFLLAIVLVFVLVDFGAIGVVIGGILALVTGSIAGILPLSPFYFASFIIMAIILIYRLSK